MRVVEEFHTLQGEGRFLGVPSYFIRTTGCNLRCAWKNSDGTKTLCDTPYTSWNPEAGYELNLEETLQRIPTTTRHVVITGGEPLLQKDLPFVANQLLHKGYLVTVETNSTRLRDGLEGVFFSISPKLRGSYEQDEGSVEAVIHKTNNDYLIPIKHYMKYNDFQLKFVINNEEDLQEAQALITSCNIAPHHVYLMPQGIHTTQFEEKNKWLFKECMQYGYNYTPRLHIEVFGNERKI